MKKNIIIIVFVLFSIVSTFAQSNFKNGYIITNSNDTVSGLIDFRTDVTNSHICKFKQHESDPEKEYLPGEIAGYRFMNEGKYYVSKTVEIEKIEKKVFLEFLLQGILNLYYFPEGNGYYFFEGKDGQMVSTTKNSDIITEKNILKEDNRYKGVLSYVFREYIPLSVESEKAQFDRKTMIEYTKKYHDKMCDSGAKCIIFENDYKKKFTKFDLTTYTGFEMNILKQNYNSEVYNSTSLSPLIGCEMDISSPRFLKSLSLILDVNCSRISGAFDYSSTQSYSQYSYNGIKSSFSGGLKYTYDKGKIRPCIEIGLSYCHLFSLKSLLKQAALNYDNSIVTVITQNDILPLKSYAGIRGGVGIDYKLREYQFITARIMYHNIDNQGDKINTFELKLGYKFKL
jgi:hypothetical protein